MGFRNCEKLLKFVNFSFLHIYFYFSTLVVEFVIVTLDYFKKNVLTTRVISA